MLTINLEKKLLKENIRLFSDKDLLVVEEYNKNEVLLANQSYENVLKRIGLNVINDKGKKLVEHTDALSKHASKFGTERVFHISQIKSLCEKYYLKFLRTDKYKGTIDNMVPQKIINFELAFNVECNVSDMYIAAPSKSFELEKKPEDPLLFYRINSEYYYLIHKWGNDLNIFSRLKNLFSKIWFCSWLTILFPIFIGMFFTGFYFGFSAMQGFYVASIVLFIMVSIVNIVGIEDDEGWRFFGINKYNEPYKN